MICATESACLDTSMIHTDIVTDSQSVANVTCFRETHDLSTWGHEVANYELVESLNKSWKKGCFRIRKINLVSHLTLQVTYWGNDGLWETWSLTLSPIRRCPKQLLDQARQIFYHRPSNHL